MKKIKISGKLNLEKFTVAELNSKLTNFNGGNSTDICTLLPETITAAPETFDDTCPKSADMGICTTDCCD